MSRFLIYLGRIFFILFAYLVAVAAASAAFLALGTVMFTRQSFDGEELRWAVLGTAVFGVPMLSLLTAYKALVPAMLAIAASEYLSKRDWLFHALAGGVVAVAAIGMPRLQFDVNRADSMSLIAIFVGCGMVGGIVYWAVAGRSAGRWRERVDASRLEQRGTPPPLP